MTADQDAAAAFVFAHLGESLPESGGTIGSSDAAAVLGVGWGGRGPWSVWSRLVGLTQRDSSSSTGATRRGQRLERVVLGWWADGVRASGRRVEVEPGPPVEAPAPTRGGWAHAHQDAIAEYPEAGDYPGGREVVEVKTARWFDPDWDAGQVPIRYRIQACHLAYVLDLPVRIVAYGLSEDELRAIPLDLGRAVARQAEILEAWHVRHVQHVEPPPIDSSEDCSRALARIYRRPTRKIQPSPGALELCRELAQVRREIGALEARGGVIENLLREEIGDALGLELVTPPVGRQRTPRTRTLVSWTAPGTRRVVDLEALRAEAPELVDRHTVERPADRRFTFYPKAMEKDDE